MEYTSKEDIIHALAQSAGIADTYNTKYGGSRYDAATGTLYCAGIALPHSSLQTIISWYKQQMEQYKVLASKDKTLTEQYMRYAVAYNAICMLKDNLS